MSAINTIVQENKDIGLTTELYRAMDKVGIDIPLSIERIRRANAGNFDNVSPIKAKKLPDSSDTRIFNPSNYTITLPFEIAQRRIDDLHLPTTLNLKDIGIYNDKNGSISFNPIALEKLGLYMAPVTAFGYLNGGSASSYLDRKRIRKAYPELLTVYKDLLPQCDTLCADKPKGCTPAYWNPDGTPGYSFLALKIRALLIRHLKWKKLTGIHDSTTLYPIFEMTSHLTDSHLKSAYSEYANTELLSGLCKSTGWNHTSILSAKQPLLAAMSPEKPYTIFSRTNGKINSPLAMPGGHGHSFYVLKNIYKQMYDSGIRFAYLGNIDNSGFLINDRSLAVMALTGKQGCFDFSKKTEADIKGGILLEDQNGRLNCGDIGLAISEKRIQEYEQKNTPILFNTASGLFNLEWLINNLDRIISDLPTRLTVQDKDRGKYTQAEQITWEVLGMMDDKLICMVDKYERFIASKMIVEMLMASQLKPDRTSSPTFPEELRNVAANLSNGLAKLLSHPYGLSLNNGRWEPLTIHQMMETIQ